MPTLNSYQIRCAACMTKNRIPADKAGQPAKCGKCGAVFETRSLLTQTVLVVTDQTFDLIIIKSPLPLLLDCWAQWCGPCRMVAPILEQLAAEWKGKALIGKLNVDENHYTSQTYRIESIPTLMIFDRGELKDRVSGALPRQEMIRKMTPWFYS